MRSRRSSRDRITKFSASFLRYSSNVRTLIARPARPVVARKRWPYVTAPEVTSCTRKLDATASREIVNGTTRPPYRNNSHLMGRPNRNSPLSSSSCASQCICFGNVRSRSTFASTSGNTSTVARPRVRRWYERYLPRGVSTCWSASKSAPSLRANPKPALVGWPAASTYHKYKAGDHGALAFDTLTRLSLVLGIYKSLQVLYPEPALADGWMRMPNTNPMFGGAPPLSLAIDAGIDGLYRIRRLLDARRG